MEIGDAAADVYQDDLEVAFRQNHARLVRQFALVVGDHQEAEDIVQMAFLRAIETRPITSERGLEGWLAVVGLRLAIDERRRRRRWGFLEVRETDQAWAMSADPDLWTVLQTLDRRSRAALVLTILDGYTQDEVAAAFEVPRGTVASWLSRARDRLRPLLEDRI